MPHNRITTHQDQRLQACAYTPLCGARKFKIPTRSLPVALLPSNTLASTTPLSWAPLHEHVKTDSRAHKEGHRVACGLRQSSLNTLSCQLSSGAFRAHQVTPFRCTFQDLVARFNRQHRLARRRRQTNDPQQGHHMPPTTQVSSYRGEQHKPRLQTALPGQKMNVEMQLIQSEEKFLKINMKNIRKTLSQL